MPSNTKLSRMLDAGANLTVDGALATELEAHGCDLDDPLWSAKVLLEQPQLVKRVHRDYFRAGAAVAITASYQATPQGFARRGIGEEEALELVALSVRLADEARQRAPGRKPGCRPPADCRIGRSVRRIPGRWVGIPGRLLPQPKRVHGVPPAANCRAGGRPERTFLPVRRCRHLPEAEALMALNGRVRRRRLALLHAAGRRAHQRRHTAGPGGKALPGRSRPSWPSA